MSEDTEAKGGDSIISHGRGRGDGMTPRERRFLQARIIEGLPAREALIKAGYRPNPSHATALQHRLEARGHVKRVLEEAGLDMASLAKKTAELLNARAYGLTKDGVPVELGPDGHVQQRTAEMIWRLHDAFPNPKLDVSHQVQGAIVLRPGEGLGEDPFAVTVEGEAREVEEEE